MRRGRPLAFAGLFVVVLAAVLGLASFTAEPPPPTAPEMIDGAGISTYVSGRLTAAVLSSRLRDPGLGGSPTSYDEASQAPPSASTLAVPEEPVSSDDEPASSSRSSAPPTLAPSTPASSTPPTTPPAPTLPPVTRPPTTFLPDVERWRPLVATYFSADLLDEALSVMQCESKGDPDASNPNSTASGLYQFIASTWNWASANAGFTGVSVFDPEANIATAAFLAEYSIDRGLPAWQHWVCQPDVAS